MSGDGARLSIDFWHTTLRAVTLRPDGTVMTVMVDGDTSMPTGVAVTEDGVLHAGRDGAAIGADHPHLYVRLPGQRLFEERIQVGPVEVDPVDLVAETLRHLARQAGAATGGALPTDVVICTPAWWVPRQQQRLRTAARRAGLANPRLLDCPDAILRDQAGNVAPVPVGAVVVVCRLDATVGEVVVLCRRVDGLERLATLPLGEVGETAGETLVEQAATALTEALQEAGIPGEQVAAVYCHAPETAMSALASALTASAGLAAPPVRVGEMAAAAGGLYTTLPTGRVKPRWRYARLFHSLGGIAAGGFGAGFLAYQVFESGQVYEATTISPKMLVTQWCAWGLASLFALLALVSTALAVADLRAIRSGHADNPDGPDPKLGSSLTFAAALGVGLAAMFALVGGASFGFNPGPMLTWTLGSTVPAAVVITVIGLLAVRAPIRGGWRDRLRFPVEASALAAVSTVAVVGSYVAIPFQDRNTWWAMEHAGAIGIGYAAAWLVTRRWTRLIIVGSLLGGPATFAISLDTFDVIGAFLIGAVTVWWLARLVQIVGPMLPGLVGAGTGPAPTVAPAAAEAPPRPGGAGGRG